MNASTAESSFVTRPTYVNTPVHTMLHVSSLYSTETRPTYINTPVHIILLVSKCIVLGPGQLTYLRKHNSLDDDACRFYILYCV